MQRYPPRSGPPRPPRVDRSKTCPSLVRVFVKTGAHHPDSAFSHAHLPTHDELQLFTWRDSTLREILLLARDALPSLAPSPAAPAAASTARYSLRLVYYDPDSSSYKSSDLASIPARDLALAASDLPASSRLDRTLADAKFVPGDFLALAHLGSEGPAPPAPPAAAAHGANGGVGVARAGAAPFGIRGAARGAGPQFAPLHQGGGGAGAGAGRPHGGPGGPPGPGARRPSDTWAPAGPRGGGGAPGGPGAGPRGGYGPRGGAGGPPPMDQGWGSGPRGARTSGGGGGGGGAGYPPPQGRFDDRDRPPHQRRRSSRSRSPVRGPAANGVGRDRDRPRSRSPPPPARRRRDSDAAAMRD